MREARVTMIWPAEIKERVHELAGPRGLTKFVLDAVKEKLAERDQMRAERMEQELARPKAAPKGPCCPQCGEELVMGECWTCG